MTASPSQVRRGRTGIVVVLIVALVAAGLTRDGANDMRSRGTLPGTQNASGPSLANMNSFALALLLGGLRGPLVMVLWTQSESLKNEKNLEDFDTYVEWIRLLQPEFDTVHIFQVWNKAYNISVQMAATQNKYTTILDALDYANRVLAERPDDLSMVYQVASIYFDKLGNASEKDYYRRRVREESLPHKSRQRLRPDEAGWRRLDLDPVLDASGHVLPQLLKANNPRPATLPAGQDEWWDGSKMQYLKPYDDKGFPYGLSTFGIAYNDHKIAQVMQDVQQQRHANLSELVVDSRPALSLKAWSEDEWEVGRKVELKAFNVTLPPERRDMEVGTANLAVDTPASSKAALEEAIFSYDLSARLARDAMPEYARHLRKFSTNFTSYQSHMDGLAAQEQLVLGDRDYLKAMLASGNDRAALLKTSAEHYKNSMRLNIQLIMRYYLPEELLPTVLPAGMTRSDTSKLTYDQCIEAYTKLVRGLRNMQIDSDQEDRSDYQRYVERAFARVDRIERPQK